MGFPSEMMKMSSNCGDGCTYSEYTKTHWVVHLKWVVWHMNYILRKFKKEKEEEEETNQVATATDQARHGRLWIQTVAVSQKGKGRGQIRDIAKTERTMWTMTRARGKQNKTKAPKLPTWMTRTGGWEEKAVGRLSQMCFLRHEFKELSPFRQWGNWEGGRPGANSPSPSTSVKTSFVTGGNYSFCLVQTAGIKVVLMPRIILWRI